LNDAEHGYLQSAVDLDVVGLTSACRANVFIRSVSNSGSPGTGDRDVGTVAPCIPVDANDDHIVDLAEPDGCDADANCPGGGVCINRRCVFPRRCDSDSECRTNESCVDGSCVADGGQSCTDDGQCDGLVCTDGECMPCSSDGMCGTGQGCGPDGRCTDGTSSTSSMTDDDGIELAPDEEVQGGAFTCAAFVGQGSPPRGLPGWFWLLGSLLGLGLLIRRG
jgi:hypothetical protein